MPEQRILSAPPPSARLSGAHGEFVEFSIVSYQYQTHVPEDDHDYDANWLFVGFRVSDAAKTWGSVEPAWLTWDVADLIDWLQAIAAGITPSNAWTALEPLLSLECLEPAPEPQLVAVLALELRSADAKALGVADQAIRLSPRVDELLTAAAVLAAGLQSFPPR